MAAQIGHGPPHLGRAGHEGSEGLHDHGGQRLPVRRIAHGHPGVEPVGAREGPQARDVGGGRPGEAHVPQDAAVLPEVAVRVGHGVLPRAPRDDVNAHGERIPLADALGHVQGEGGVLPLVPADPLSVQPDVGDGARTLEAEQGALAVLGRPGGETRPVEQPAREGLGRRHHQPRRPDALPAMVVEARLLEAPALEPQLPDGLGAALGQGEVGVQLHSGAPPLTVERRRGLQEPLGSVGAHGVCRRGVLGERPREDDEADCHGPRVHHGLPLLWLVGYTLHVRRALVTGSEPLRAI